MTRPADTMRAPTREEIAGLVAIAHEHGRRCNVCDALATRSYVDPSDGARVMICDAAACAELWRCDRCGATDFAASYCPLCGHTGITLAVLVFTDAPHAAGLRYAAEWEGGDA